MHVKTPPLALSIEHCAHCLKIVEASSTQTAAPLFLCSAANLAGAGAGARSQPSSSSPDSTRDSVYGAIKAGRALRPNPFLVSILT